ncbi:hypothetical protein AB0K68_01695 [Streptomyces sp. NPDC050698]
MTRRAQPRSRVPGTASAGTAGTKGNTRSGPAASPVIVYVALRPSAATAPRLPDVPGGVPVTRAPRGAVSLSVAPPAVSGTPATSTMPSRPGTTVAAPHSPPSRAAAGAPGSASTPATTAPATAVVFLYLFIAGGAPCAAADVDGTVPAILRSVRPGGACAWAVRVAGRQAHRPRLPPG